VKKNAETHVALHEHFSAPVRVTDLVEASKDAASLLVHSKKIYFISEGVLGHLGPLYLALGTNR